MDIRAYIESGILQEYILGFLSQEEKASVKAMVQQYPEIANALRNHEKALENYAQQRAVTPPSDLKDKMVQLIRNTILEEDFTLNNTPVLNKFSDYKNWMKVIQPLLPETMDEDVFAKVIRDDGKITQTLIKTRAHYPDEVHEELYESFIVLEGECECYIGNEVVRLGPGSFIEIPLHEHHDVKVLSEYVVAIQQRIAV